MGQAEGGSDVFDAEQLKVAVLIRNKRIAVLRLNLLCNNYNWRLCAASHTADEGIRGKRSLACSRILLLSWVCV